MFHLSDSGRHKAKSRELWIINANAFSALTDRKYSFADKADAFLDMMEIDWAPALVKAVGFKPMNGALKYVRGDVCGPEQYRLFADMVVQASDGEIPLEHTHSGRFRASY